MTRPPPKPNPSGWFTSLGCHRKFRISSKRLESHSDWNPTHHQEHRMQITHPHCHKFKTVCVRCVFVLIERKERAEVLRRWLGEWNWSLGKLLLRIRWEIQSITHAYTNTHLHAYDFVSTRFSHARASHCAKLTAMILGCYGCLQRCCYAVAKWS